MFQRGHFPGCSAVRESDNPHRPVDRRPLSLPSSRPSARRARRAGMTGWELRMYPPTRNSRSIAGRQAGVGAFQTRSMRPTPLSPSSRPSARRARRAGTQLLALDAARPACRSRGCWVPALRASRSGRDDGDGEWRMCPPARSQSAVDRLRAGFSETWPWSRTARSAAAPRSRSLTRAKSRNHAPPSERWRGLDDLPSRRLLPGTTSTS